jgi:4-amino-4-deoxy-L-arabinose transferase-like glycosyltransferase
VNARWMAWVGPLCAPLLFVLALSQVTPLGTAFGYYGNEGFNLMKALLTVEGHGLYREVWSDQPPLFTFLLAGLFKLFGFSILAARLMVLFFGAVLVLAFLQIVQPKIGMLATWAALTLLLFSPNFMQLSVSAMIMIPSLALALLAVWALLRYRENHQRGYLLLSGVCLALSLQTKMDTLLLLPACVLELFLIRRQTRKPVPSPNEDGHLTPAPDARSPLTRPAGTLSPRRGEGRGEGAGSPSFLWLGTVVGGFLLVALMLGWNTDFLVGTHLGAPTRTAFSPTGNVALTNMLVAEQGTNLLALAGVTLVLWRKRWDLLFPVVWLATELIVRSWHRPFWPYHYLHLAVPLAWLAGIALKLGWDWLLTFDLVAFKKPPFKGAVALLLFSLLLSLAAVDLPDHARREWVQLHPTDPPSAWKIVQLMKDRQASTRWVFADNVMYPFYAGLPVPPEIAVLSAKRLQAGLITHAEILDVLRRYRPEQAVLQQSIFGDKIMTYLKEHYMLKLEDGSLRYYVLNEIDQIKPTRP